MLDHATPDPADDAGCERDSRLSDCDAEGASGANGGVGEASRAGSAASFRALTQRLESRRSGHAATPSEAGPAPGPRPVETASAPQLDGSAAVPDPGSMPELPLRGTPASLRAETEALLRTFADEPEDMGTLTPEADEAVRDIARIFEGETPPEAGDDQSRPFTDCVASGDGADVSRPEVEIESGEADATPDGPIETSPDEAAVAAEPDGEEAETAEVEFPPSEILAGEADTVAWDPERAADESQPFETVSEAPEPPSAAAEADTSGPAAGEALDAEAPRPVASEAADRPGEPSGLDTVGEEAPDASAEPSTLPVGAPVDEASSMPATSRTAAEVSLAERMGEPASEGPPERADEGQPSAFDPDRPASEVQEQPAVRSADFDTEWAPPSEPGPDPADANAPAGTIAAEAAAGEPASAGGEPGWSETSEDVDPPPLVAAPLPPSGGESRSAQTARILLDIMSMPSGASQPQERALAGDTLLRLVDGMTLDGLVLLSERLSLMEAPPALLVRRLLAHPRSEVAAPLLERCTAIADQDLIELAVSVDLPRLRMIARRRHVSTALADALIRHGDSSLDLTLIRNPNARFSHEAFSELGERATRDATLQAPLATRADTPAPVAFELFWYLPAELRRYVLSRFLTDSVTLERILSIARGMDRAFNGSAALTFPDPARLAELADRIEEGDPAAAAALARLACICEENALRIIADPGGEPLMVAMKALGLPRARFGDALQRWRRSACAALGPDRDLSDLQALFDSLSFNKARVLLTYWDWAALRSGPYERRAA